LEDSKPVTWITAELSLALIGNASAQKFPGRPVGPEAFFDAASRKPLGHKKVELAAEVYERANSTDIGQALHVVGKQLPPIVLPNQSES
jgi:hypothetical protein